MKAIYITLFAIAMAFLETAVVIYLRALMYPEGFAFPLEPIPPELALTEVLREAATLIMLAIIGCIAGKYFTERFAWFIYTFAVWDIFYYVFLKLMIGWPESLLTWDILFLIPTIWTGPVIAPVLVSLQMISLALVILYFSGMGNIVKIKPLEWAGLIAGSIILILGFIWDYSVFMLKHFSFIEIIIFPDMKALFETSVKYIPDRFNWLLFLCGSGLIVLVIIVVYYRIKLYRLTNEKYQ